MGSAFSSACGGSQPISAPPDATEAQDDATDSPQDRPDDEAGSDAATPAPAKAAFTHPKLAACDGGDMSACNDVAVALVKGDGVEKDAAAALTYMKRSCDGDYGLGCFNGALMVFKGDLVDKDEKAATVGFDKACALNHPDGCLQAGVMHLQGRGTPKNVKLGMTRFEKGCGLKEPVSCRNIGITLAQGKAVPKDRDRARSYFAKGCKMGDADSCKFEKELSTPEAPAAATVAGANLTMGKLSADGLTLQNVSCKAAGLGFLGGVLIAGGLSKKKAQLKACAPRGAKPVVRWSFAGNRVTSVSVTGESPAINACVKRVVKSATIPGSGECVATVVIGN